MVLEEEKAKKMIELELSKYYESYSYCQLAFDQGAITMRKNLHVIFYRKTTSRIYR